MAGLVQIRNVPAGTRRVLKARAAERGISLNTLLLGLLEREAEKPAVADVLARAAARAERASAPALAAIDDARQERSKFGVANNSTT